MKFHRVLLFTKIQMEITQVGEDLHVLLTGSPYNCLDCTAYSAPIPGSDPIDCETALLSCVEDPDATMVPYVSNALCKATGKTVVCSGGLYLGEDLDEADIDKLYENIDEIIMDWVHFLD